MQPWLIKSFKNYENKTKTLFPLLYASLNFIFLYKNDHEIVIEQVMVN